MAAFHFMMGWLLCLRSLRAVLCAAAVSAGVVSYWLQPIEVKVNFPMSTAKGCNGPGNRADYEIRSCRRQLPAHWVQHGLTTAYDSQHRKLVESTWERGVQHGPYRHFDCAGYLYETGQYENGVRSGQWRTQSIYVAKMYAHSGYEFHEVLVDPSTRTILLDYDAGKLVRKTHLPRPGDHQYLVEEYSADKVLTEITRAAKGDQLLNRVTIARGRRNGPAFGRYGNGKPRYTGYWSDNKADGEWKLWDVSGRQIESLKFNMGLLVERNSVPITDFPSVAQSLLTSSINEFWSCGWYLQRPFEVPDGSYSLAQFVETTHLQVDRRIMKSMAPTISLEVFHDGLPMDAALYLLLRPHGLTIESKYEQGWITTPELVKTWRRDRGLDQLVVLAGSNLNKILDETTEIEFRSTPLVDALTFLQDLHHHEIILDETGCQPGELANIEMNYTIKGISLRAVLATLLDNHDLRVEVRNDALVIFRGQIATAEVEGR